VGAPLRNQGGSVEGRGRDAGRGAVRGMGGVALPWRGWGKIGWLEVGERPDRWAPPVSRRVRERGGVGRRWLMGRKWKLCAYAGKKGWGGLLGW
jgi:hypothetical protein